MKEKSADDSAVTLTEVVFPNDTNPLGIARGGRIMDWMDIAAAVCAQQHANMIAVTASADRMIFTKPVKLGDILSIRARMVRAFRTSMEIFVEVWVRRLPEETSFRSHQAYFTFVGINEEAKPSLVPQVIPATDDDKIRYESSLRRYNRFKLMQHEEQ